MTSCHRSFFLLFLFPSLSVSSLPSWPLSLDFLSLLSSSINPWITPHPQGVLGEDRGEKRSFINTCGSTFVRKRTREKGEKKESEGRGR